MRRHHATRRIAIRAMCIGAAGIGTLLCSQTGAEAQERSTAFETGLDSVTVDLSVLDNGGRSSTPIGSLRATGGFLLVPGPDAPSSRLYVTPGKGIAELPRSAKKRPSQTVATAEPKPEKTDIAEAPAATVDRPERARPPAEPSMRETRPRPQPPVAMAQPAPPPATKPKPKPKKEEKPSARQPEPKGESQVAAAPAPPGVPPPPSSTAAQAPPPPPTITAPPKPSAEEEKSQQPESKQEAALPPTDASMAPGQAFRVVFESNAAKLPDSAKAELERLVESVVEKTDLRLQLLAYAGGESLSSSKARRLSLSRALSIRSYLIENGLRSTRIDVRALGNKTSEEPVNRVDINIVER